MEGLDTLVCESGQMLHTYWYERISSRIFLFGRGRPGSGGMSGVIAGDNKYLIIDGDSLIDSEALDYIRAILGQDKPFLYACTHGHSFPQAGESLFDEVLLNHRDYFMLSEDEKGFVTDIDEGDMIDLGGISFWPISVSAHTPGSLVYLCGEENLCFTGDSIDRRIYATELNREAMIKCRDLFMRLSTAAGDSCRFFSGCSPYPMEMQAVKNLAAACFEVALRKTESDLPLKISFKNNKMLDGKRLMLHSVRNTEIVYDSNLIWA